MIVLGPCDRVKRVADYVSEHGISRMVVVHATAFPLALPEMPGVRVEHVPWPDIITYRVFYRLLQELDARSLVVVHEMMTHDKRSELTYNCVRHYLAKAGHRLIFQTSPVVSSRDDFMILFDWETGSKWKHLGLADAPLREAQIEGVPCVPRIDVEDVPSSPALRKKYARQRERLFAQLGERDPHIIPRTLALLAGGAKAEALHGRRAVARNQRLKRPDVVPYGSESGGERCVLEFPHEHLKWCAFVARTWAERVTALVTDLPVDRWYFDRFRTWTEECHAVRAAIQG